MKEAEMYTYPNMLLDNGKENVDYDKTIRVFSVPEEWVINWIRNNIDCDCDGRPVNLDDFSDEETMKFFCENYTWDDTEGMYRMAKEENVLIKEEIISREEIGEY